MRIDAALLVRAIGCTPEAAARFAQPLASTCSRFRINTPERLAAFLAQIGSDSADLTARHGLFMAVWNGDHARVRDRVAYAMPGVKVSDFEAHPLHLREPIWSSLAAGDFWVDKDCNDLADRGNFSEITRRIAGCSCSESDRMARLWMARSAIAARLEPEMIAAQGFITPHLIPAESVRQDPKTHQMAREVAEKDYAAEKKKAASGLGGILSKLFS